MTFGNTAYAETVAGYLSAADWYMIVSTETGAPVILQQSAPPSHWMSPGPVNFNLSFTKNNLASRNLYIIAASTPNDGAAPLIAGVLSGSKTIITGDSRIKVLSSSYDSTALPNIAVIDELIKRELGGSYQSTYSQTKTLTDHINFSAAARAQMSGTAAHAIWGNPAVSPDNGSYVVFRIPYSALFNPPEEKADPVTSSGSTSSGGNSGGVNVSVDVGGLLGSLFGKKDKDKDAPTDTATAQASSDPVATVDPVVIADPPADTQTTTSPVISLPPPPPPKIITQYVENPDIIADRDQLRDQNSVMEKVIRSQTEMLKKRESLISGLQTQLNRAQNGIASVPELLAPKNEIIARQAETITTLNTKTAKNAEQIEAMEADIQNLKNSAKPLSKAALIAGGLGGLGLGALAGLMIGRRRHNKTCDLHLPPLKKEDEEEKEPKDGSDLSNLKKGMAFAASPMALGGLPMSLAAIKPVYDAVGRIGFAQKGKPTGEEEAFGTGILISDIHVLTNRHVWEMFRDRLAGDQGAGIEFHAEKDKDKTDFIAFDGAEPVCIHGQDAAIFTLSRKPEARAPVTFAPRPIKQLNDLEVVVVGYPQAHRMTPDIAAVTEDNPIFGVKRYSEGKIFRHSTDIDTPYGVEAAVSEIINPARTLRAICHNASTLGGSSGSAVICKKTGDLVALHFGFDTAYDWEEATNFAIAGDMLAEDVAKIIENA